MNPLITIGIVLLVIAIIAYVLGARGMAGFTASVGKTVLLVGLVLAVILIIVGLL